MERKGSGMEIREEFLNCIYCKPEDLKITEDSMQVWKLADSIKEYGQLVPIICYRIAEGGNLILIDGKLIIKALSYLGRNTGFVLDVGVKTEQEALQIWCALSLNQRPINYIELAKKIKSRPEIKKALAKQTTLLQEEIDTLEKILDFDWSCFAKAKEQAEGPDLFGGFNGNQENNA